MTAPGAGTPAAPNPGRVAAFGHVAREAFTAARDADTGEGYNPADWDKLHDGWWEAAAMAVIEAANVPLLIVEAKSPLTEADMAELRKRFEEAVRTGRPTILAEHGSERTAELVTEANDLRAQLAAVIANRDAWCERAGELLTDARKD